MSLVIVNKYTQFDNACVNGCTFAGHGTRGAFALRKWFRALRMALAVGGECLIDGDI